MGVAAANIAYSISSYCACFMQNPRAMERIVDVSGGRRQQPFGGCSVSEQIRIWHTYLDTTYPSTPLTPGILSRLHFFFRLRILQRRREAPTRDGRDLAVTPRCRCRHRPRWPPPAQSVSASVRSHRGYTEPEGPASLMGELRQLTGCITKMDQYPIAIRPPAFHKWACVEGLFSSSASLSLFC